MKKIKDIIGNTIEITNLRLAIKECKACVGSPFVMGSGYTVGENHAFMLRQLEKIKKI